MKRIFQLAFVIIFWQLPCSYSKLKLGEKCKDSSYMNETPCSQNMKCSGYTGNCECHKGYSPVDGIYERNCQKSPNYCTSSFECLSHQHCDLNNFLCKCDENYYKKRSELSDEDGYCVAKINNTTVIFGVIMAIIVAVILIAVCLKVRQKRVPFIAQLSSMADNEPPRYNLTNPTANTETLPPTSNVTVVVEVLTPASSNQEPPPQYDNVTNPTVNSGTHPSTDNTTVPPSNREEPPPSYDSLF